MIAAHLGDDAVSGSLFLQATLISGRPGTSVPSLLDQPGLWIYCREKGSSVGVYHLVEAPSGRLQHHLVKCLAGSWLYLLTCSRDHGQWSLLLLPVWPWRTKYPL